MNSKNVPTVRIDPPEEDAAKEVKEVKKERKKNSLEPKIFTAEMMRLLLTTQMEADNLKFPEVTDIYGLEFYSYTNQFIMYVVQDKYDGHWNRNSGYQLDFKQESDEMKYVTCRVGREDIWKVDLDPKTDLLFCAVEHFADTMYPVLNTMKKLAIVGMGLSECEFDFRCARILEELEIGGDVNIDDFLPYIGHPMKKLTVKTITQPKPISEYPQIYYIQDEVCLPWTSLTLKQFKKIPARRIRISIGGFTVENLFELIDDWVEGYGIETFADYKFDYHNCTFDVNKLLGMLKIDPNDFDEETIELYPRSRKLREGFLHSYKNSFHFNYKLERKGEPWVPPKYEWSGVKKAAEVKPAQ